MLFAQFVDQGIIGIDDPVGKYLPDFPVSGPNAVTMRHCFTHTSGFYGHYLFQGVHNPWLENTLAMVIKDDTVGRVHMYNGMGYDLAGKVMEAVTGKSIFRLFREYLYDPLEMNHTVHDLDLGFSCKSTAYDLAKVAQLLSNQGTYGDLQFFSPATYEMIIPKDLNEFYPGVNQKWGIGINFQRLTVKDEKTGEQRFLLDHNMLGHGSATACIFWVDRKHDLVITQTRRGRSKVFWPNLRQVIEVVDRYVTE
jgi:CubicO group peptidase (beta-lactamase class C family)